MTRRLAIYALKFPIIRDTRDVTGNEHEEILRPAGFEVVLKRARAKDMRLIDNFEGREVSGSIALIARISNLTEEEAELLDAEDLGELGNVLSGIVPAGPETGIMP